MPSLPVLLRLAAVGAVALVPLAPPARAQQEDAWFEGIGVVPAGSDILGTGINGVGDRVAVGFQYNEIRGTSTGIRWTHAGGIEAVSTADGVNGQFVVLYSVSEDGSVAVGDNRSVAVRSTSGGLAPFDETLFSFSYAVAADGSFAVGDAYPEQFRVAVRYGFDDTLLYLGEPPGAFDSSAQGISANGRHVVGRSFVGITGTRAFRWSEGEPNASLLPELIENGYSEARAVSRDGNVIVGRAGQSSPGPWFPVRWTRPHATAPFTVEPLGPFPGGATGVSGNGRRIVGFADFNVPGPFGALDLEAFVWEADAADAGMRRFAEVLAERLPAPEAAEAANWYLGGTPPIFPNGARGISRDGRTIGGIGVRNLGGGVLRTEGWVAYLPEPGGPGAALAAGAALLALARGRRAARAGDTAP